MAKIVYEMLTKGMQRNIEPHNLANDAFETLHDCYQFRDHVKKRVGTTLIRGSVFGSRLRVNVGTGDENGNYNFTIPGKKFTVGQSFSIKGDLFLVVEEGDDKPLKTKAPLIKKATYSTTTGKISIEGSYPGESLYFYPGEPVMGLIRRELPAINFEDTIAFDTQFAYRMSETGWERLGSAVWTGDDSNFFWGVNFRDTKPEETTLFVTNNVDPIRYIRFDQSEWKDLRPKLNTSGGDRYLETAKIIFVFENYLYVANTLETVDGSKIRYKNRVRRAQRGYPTGPRSWVDDVTGQGAYNMVPLQVAILSTNITYSRRILSLERGYATCTYTGYPDDPMRIDMIDFYQGGSGTFSLVSLNDTSSCVDFGNIGIYDIRPAYDGVNRIDDAIPDEVYRTRKCCANFDRIHGFQDRTIKLIYWTLPFDKTNARFPQRLLVYNYQTQNYAYFFDTFTCFGRYHERNEMTWDTVGNYFPTWDTWNEPWDSGRRQTAFPLTIAGNQQGFVFIMNPNVSTNDLSLQVLGVEGDVIFCKNHNLVISQYVRLEGAEGNPIVQVNEIIDRDHFRVDYEKCGPNYEGTEYIRLISNPDMWFKQFNLGVAQEKNMQLASMSLLLKMTHRGEHTIDYYRNTSQYISEHDLQTKNSNFWGNRTIRSYPEDGKLYTQKSQKYWHKYQRSCHGGYIQPRLYMRDEQIRNWEIASQDMVVYGFILDVTTEGNLI